MACFLLATSACHRANLASWVPTLHVQFHAQRQERASVQAKWHASVTGWLRFQPTIAATTEPLRFDMRSEAEVLPCGLEDSLCNEEFIEGEALGAGSLLGDLE